MDDYILVYMAVVTVVEADNRWVGDRKVRVTTVLASARGSKAADRSIIYAIHQFSLLLAKRVAFLFMWRNSNYY